MGRLYSTYHIQENGDRSIKLRELKECEGTYSLEIGNHHLIICGALEDLNDLGFEILHLTNLEKEKKRAMIIEAEIAAQGEK